MDECTFLSTVNNQDVSNRETREGYKVIDSDGYMSWVPKNTFENNYKKITEDERILIEFRDFQWGGK